MYEAVDGAEALIIHTDWTMFRTPDFDRLKSRLKKPVIFDGRNLYNPEKLERLGFDYFYIGSRKLPNKTCSDQLSANRIKLSCRLPSFVTLRQTSLDQRIKFAIT